MKKVSNFLVFSFVSISILFVAAYSAYNVISGGSSQKVERATIAGNAVTATITSQSGTWITFTSRGGTGDYVWTISGFSAAPSCTCTSIGSSGGTPRFCTIRTLTQTSLGTLQTDSAGSATDADSASIVCMGPR